VTVQRVTAGRVAGLLSGIPHTSSRTFARTIPCSNEKCRSLQIKASTDTDEELIQEGQDSLEA